ncbi:MAG TPA: pyridoxamine 5'-phosphate oxidase family protein [Pseudonocardiaceae bacterium]|nr:pyridoxamine 5'-phosphate oxidase family protein [Pseudonocardiaceae bacterium]
MSFTEAERNYLAGQMLGRFATVGPDGTPQVRPLRFRLNPHDTIDLGGPRLTSTQIPQTCWPTHEWASSSTRCSWVMTRPTTRSSTARCFTSSTLEDAAGAGRGPGGGRAHSWALGSADRRRARLFALWLDRG